MQEITDAYDDLEEETRKINLDCTPFFPSCMQHLVNL